MEQLPEVIEADLSFSTGKLVVASQNPDTNAVMERVTSLGYQIKGEASAEKTEETTKTSSNSFFNYSYFMPMCIAGLALGLGLLLNFMGVNAEAVRWVYWFGIAAGIIGPALNGWATLKTLRELDMNALMVIAVIGAAIIGEYHEALAVVFLFALGNFLQVYTFDRTRNSIRKLMDLTPRQALVRRNGMEQSLPVSEIRIGDTVLIRPGETIPADGRIVIGNSTVNQAAITGESVPVFKEINSEVFAGTTNGNGYLEIAVSREFKDTTINRIMIMVEEAQASRAPSQQIIDRFARYYTPAVIVLAALVAIIPPWLFNQPLQHWVYLGLAMLLVACPCALVISTPVSIVSAIGNAARQGVLIKGGSHLEELGQISVVAFDKTGTLTAGRLEVSDIIPLDGSSADHFLSLISGVEKRSEHPIAEAIVSSAVSRGITIPTAQAFAAVPGKGAQAIIDGQEYLVGSMRFLEESGVTTEKVAALLADLEAQGKTVIVMASQNQISGVISLSDQVRSNSAAAVQSLHQLGIKKVVMLTGDNKQVAGALAHNLALDDFSAELLPEDKVQAVEKLVAEHQKVAMIGDGINDAPALARATVGIAMGAAGTDVALETADVALMSDDLAKIPFAVGLGRQTVNIIKQNIAVSLLVKILILLLVIPGMLTMWLAVIGDVGTSLLVTLNGMRLLSIKTGA